MPTVNLDALIPREDFEVISEGYEIPIKHTMEINELERDAFFFGALRKPDFQRETSEWDPARVVGLIRTFIVGELVPAVILWKHRDLLFVIDGSHRLSALIAWVQDDYGDGPKSQEFFSYSIPDDQLKTAQRTRDLVEREFGSYKDHRQAIADPTLFGPDLVARARSFGVRSLYLQWVTGNAKKAESSFIRINQKAVTITPQELELIQKRRRPHTIAARAIIRKGTGHKYWSGFKDAEQKQIEDLAVELHKLIFEPSLRYPIKSLDLPAGGPVYSATALRMVYEFISLSVGVPSDEDDSAGTRTIEYLTRCRKVMRQVLSNHPSSLGLHPAVYFYSWTGKQEPILFLVMAELVVELERARRFPVFTKGRKLFEEFLIGNRSLLNQIIRKFGTKDSGKKHLRGFYERILELIGQGFEADSIVDEVCNDISYSYLQPAESPYSGVVPTRLSTQVKAGVVMRELLPNAPRCGICGGLVPSQAISIDHKERVEDGGSHLPDNTQIAHPYCNTGYKESEHSKKKRQAPSQQ